MVDDDVMYVLSMPLVGVAYEGAGGGREARGGETFVHLSLVEVHEPFERKIYVSN